jgi:SNF2 family DNA or RNA helicase
MLLKLLRSHQVEAVDKAEPYPGFAFFLEQRTGKTLAALALVDRRKPSLLLIVTLKKGRRVWMKEIQESMEFDWPCSVRVIHYQRLHRDRKQIRKLFREHGPEGIFIIGDESHLFKRRGSQASRVMRSLAKLSQWRLALTGTPLAPRSTTKRRKRAGNIVKVTAGLEDAWAQFDFIDPAIFGSHDDFCDRYLKKGGFRGFKVIGYQNKKEFYELFHKYSYRKLLREVQEVPTKICRRRVRFDLSPKTRRIYIEMDREMSTLVNGSRVTLPLVVSKTTKLQQISSGFLIDGEEDRIHEFGKDKLNALEKLLRELFSQGHREKIVICAKFTRELSQAAKLIRRMGLTHQLIAGGTEYDGEFNVDVALVQIKSGVAIDLSHAKHFVFYSCSHNFIEYEQARFRILAYDTRQAMFYYLMARDSMDELVYEAQTRKKDLSTLVFDYYRRKRK